MVFIVIVVNKKFYIHVYPVTHMTSILILASYWINDILIELRNSDLITFPIYIAGYLVHIVVKCFQRKFELYSYITLLCALGKFCLDKM